MSRDCEGTKTRIALAALLVLLTPSVSLAAWWGATGSMGAPRQDHTSTVLLDGRLLAAGGRNAGGALASSEIFDPATGVWNAGGSMSGPRYDHTATLLPNGKIIVTGGRDGSGALASAEVYDPALGTWSTVAALSSARADHSATLLRNGKLLVAGGSTTSSLDTAELYDPVGNSWAPAGTLGTARSLHAAALLADGRVLVVGGTGSSAALASAEIYDPVGLTWSPTSALTTARRSHSATLLPSGKVLVTAGYGPELPDCTRPIAPAPPAVDDTLTLVTGCFSLFYGSVFYADRFQFDGVAGTPISILLTSSAFNTRLVLYDANNAFLTSNDDGGGPTNSRIPAVSGTYTLPATGRYTVEVTSGAASAFGTGPYTLTLTGSLSAASYAPVAVKGAELYDPGTGLWTSAGVTTARFDQSATLLPNGKVLIAGGSDTGVLSSAQIYDPAANSWTSEGALSTARSGHAAALLPGGKLLITGGTGAAGALASVEFYEPTTGFRTTTGSMSTARKKHAALLLPSGKVLVTGGINFVTPPHATTEIYDPAGNAGAGSWSTSGSLSPGRYLHTLTLLPTGKVLIAGGHGDVETSLGSIAALASAQVWDPAGNGGVGSWSSTGALAQGRHSHTATLLPNGQVLVAGGQSQGSYRATAEIYDPVSGGWSATASMSTPRSEHTASLLPNGKVLVVGGENGTGTVASAELYDPQSGIWTAAASLTLGPRQAHIAALLPSGRLMVVGGMGSVTYASAEVYDPLSNTWAETGPMPAARALAAAAPLQNGMLAFVGGWGGFAASGEANIYLYDATNGSWTSSQNLANTRMTHTATLLPNGRLLVVGGGYNTGSTSAELFDLGSLAASRRPIISSTSGQVGAAPLTVTGSFRGDSEASSGATGASPANYPLLQLRSIDSGRTSWLISDPRLTFADEPMTLQVSNPPATLDLGWHTLTVFSDGLPSESKAVEVVSCTLAVTQQPANQIVPVGALATFNVSAQGGRSFQWQKDGVDIPGATGVSYTTPPVVGGDSGTAYRCRVGGTCSSTLSNPAILTVADAVPPSVSVVSPSGGEYWLLSKPNAPASVQVVTWTMADNVRVCRVDVSLWYSNDGGANYVQASSGGGLPTGFGPGGTCPNPGEGTSSTTYTLPLTFPSGGPGSLYKIEVAVRDHAGLVTTVRSANPFYIVSSNPDTVRTLVLSNVGRMQSVMGISSGQASALSLKLQELSSHPRVQGFVVDLAGVTSIGSLYADWDADSSNPDKANRVLLGCHSPCAPDRNGIHDHLRTLLEAYTGVKYVVLVGDDRIIPYARVSDHTSLFSESQYPAGGDLSPTGTTVGQALAGNLFLSDDALAMTSKVIPGDLNAGLLVPDLSVGRLVETPSEITTTIATYISQDGILDVTGSTNKVLVTGYDFLTDVGKVIRKRWKGSLGVSTPDGSLAPVNGSLIGDTWGLGTVPARVSALQTQLGGHYGLINLNGHATHYEEGVPGTNPFDINGLSANTILGLDLSGSVIYGVGCHGGLSVPGSNPGDVNNSLDLPQAFLSRGAVAYVANTGYGWGLKAGIGYGERLSQLFTEQVTKSGTVSVGDAVVGTKRRYVLESVRTDPYDQKSLMQWTLYGLPMYALRTGITAAGAPLETEAEAEAGVESAEQYGGVKVERRVLQTAAPTSSSISSSGVLGSAPLPSYLTQLSLHFDFTAPGVYRKWTASGDEVVPETTACPDAGGCYYTLNGLVERSTGMADVPVQPYFIYDSRLSGTSQHGVLWKGGVYDEESGWVPVMAELQSNGGDGSNHGPAPRGEMIDPVSPRVVPGGESATCRPSDSELNSLVVPTGEAFMPPGPATTYSIERKYRSVDLEVFYFNNTVTPGQNCDRDGPVLGTGPFVGSYHQASGSTLQWGIPATDVGSGVWRVLVVYTLNTVTAGQGSWQPVELADDSGTWRGNISVGGSNLLTYVVQAVDRRGNVTWLRYVNAQLPASGVAQSMPLPVDVTVLNQAPVANAQSVTTTVGVPVPVTLTGSDPNGDALTYAVASAPLQGVLGGTAPNLTYAPLGGYAGADSFTFTVSDGALVSPAATVSVTVNAIVLSVSKSGTGLGTVTSNTGGINCGATCSAEYVQNTGVTLLAVPSAGSSFAGWSGACSGLGTCQVVMDTTKSVGAAFLPTPTIAVGSLPNPSSVGQTVTLTANVSGSGPVPTGTVQFKANGVNVGSAVALVSGAATTTTSFGSPGTRVITTEYSGDGSYLAGTGTLSGGQVVQPAGTSPRAYVSVSGSDSNTCSSPATPCRTFAGAIAQVTSGGEIVVKTSGTFGGGSIGKSVTINAPAGVAVLAATSIVVNAGATDVVTFRGITFVSPTPGSGTALTFTTGGGLNLERCVFHGWNKGLEFLGFGKLNVVDTVVRDNATAGIWLSAGVASMERTRLTGNGTGLQVLAGAEAAVKESVVAANGVGLENAGSTLDVEDSVVTHNAGAGVSGSAGTTRVSGSTLTNNAIGLQQSGSGLVVSRGGNTIEGNGANTSGTIGGYPVK